LNGLAELAFALPEAQILRGDFNNDGLVDVVFDSNVLYAKQQQPDLLQTVTDGFGAQIKFDYSPLSGATNNSAPLYTPSSQKPVFPQQHAQRGMQVVKKISTSNGLGGWRERYFNYTGAKMDVRGRGFLGFENIVVTDMSAGTVTTTRYLQDYPHIGKIARMEVKDNAGDWISITDHLYATEPHAQNPRFHPLAYSIKRQYGLTTDLESEPLSVTKTVNTFDQYGSLTAQTATTGTGLTDTTDTGVVTGVKRVVTIQNTVTNNAASWLLGFVTQSVVQTSVDGVTDLRTVTTQFQPEPNTLDVKLRTDFYGTTVSKTTTTHRENGDGVITRIETAASDPVSPSATRQMMLEDFASLGSIYPKYRKNALNHVTTLGYDKRFGVINSETDPNGLVTASAHDPLGRIERETATDGTVTKTIRYVCANAPVPCPAGAAYLAATEVTHPSAPDRLGAPLQIAYYDALQREVRSETWSLNGAVIKVDTEYYADGRVKRVSEPYTDLETGWAVYSGYDVLDRLQAMTRADGGSVAYQYLREGVLQKTVETVNVITPLGGRTQTKTRFTDALGQVTRVIDAHGTPVDYTYDAQGNLFTTMVNGIPATTITIHHDVAGNKTHLQDPDAGPIDFEYNGFGELRRQIWRQGDTANEKSMSFSYDLLGRKIGRTDDLPNSTQTVSYNWTWDDTDGDETAEIGEIGLLSSMSGNGITETYAYDIKSRLQTLTTSTDLGSRPFGYTYDAFSRPLTVTYPDGFKIEHQYQAAGIQVQTHDISVTNNPKLLWAVGKDSDARGNLYQQRFGNGVVTLETFNPLSGRIAEIRSGLPIGGNLSLLEANIQDLAYEFDTLGNLYRRTTQRDDVNGLPEFTAESFTYDDLNRLKTSLTNWTPGTRSRSYDYDDLGNLISRTGDGGIGTLIYGESIKNGGVHAVTTANGQSYHYDDYGNLIQRGSETLEYDVFNKPTRIGSTTFKYGPDHARYKQHDPGNNRTTYYIGGGLYEEVIDSSGTTKKSYVGGYLVRETLVTTTTTTTTLTYLHKDHIGSIEAMTDASGNMVSADRMSFDPWGLRQLADWSDGNPTEGDPSHYPTTRGFTEHEMLDQVNLIHMNGRVYDPVIGRFLSPDLYVQAPFNSQSFNRYSYVFNNPLSFTDPSGYETAEEEVRATCNGGPCYKEDPVERMQREMAKAYADYAAASQAARDMAYQQGALAYVITVTIDEFLLADAMLSIKAAAEGDLGGAVLNAGQALGKPLKIIDKVVDTAEKLKKNAEKAEKALKTGAESKVFSKEKEALVDMAKADKRTGVTRDDMKAYEDLNKELPDPFPAKKVRLDEGHLGGAPHSQVPHGHVGPVDHIPIVDP
jgi:RHS repeat-associated protein